MKFLLGLGIGFGLAVLFAPASGQETRHRLTERARELAERKAQQAAESIKERAGEMGERIGREAAETAVQKITDEVLGKDKTA